MAVPAFVAAVQSRSSDGVRAALAPEFKGKANGRQLDADAQVRLLEEFWAGFPAAQFQMEPVGGSGRHVITWTLSGEHGGVYAGVPPTGAAVTFSGFIVAVSDKRGILSLEWKWDPKVFTKAVLGPEDIGTLEVKDNFRADPSRRWAGRDNRAGQGGGKRRGRGASQGNQGGRGGQPGQSGQPGVPGQRRKGKGPRQPRTDEPAAQAAGQPSGQGGQPSGQESPSEGTTQQVEAQQQEAPQPVASTEPPTTGPATESKPDGKPDGT